MSLNIKNERVHALARAAAARTGRSQTSVIEIALEQYLESIESPQDDADRHRRVDAILDRMHSLLTDEDRRALTTDRLYDENGLPV